MAGAIGSDRKLASEVRRLALNKIKRILELPDSDLVGKTAELHDQILLKLSGTCLPKLTEVTGEDGEAIVMQISGMKIINDGITINTSETISE